MPKKVKRLDVNRNTAGMSEFISGVSTADSELVTGRGNLREHANNLKRISKTLLEANKIASAHVVGFWESMAAYGASNRSSHSGPIITGAYTSVRVNKILDVEFGPDETKTTEIIRIIAMSAIGKRLRGTLLSHDQTRAIEEVAILYQAKLGSVVLESVFREGNLHPLIVARLHESADTEDVLDPALARVVSTLMYREPSALRGLNNDYLVELLGSNKGIASNMSTSNEPLLSTELLDGMNLQSRLKANCYRQPDSSGVSIAQKQVIGAMYPVRGETARKAKSICRGCTIKGPCLEYAINHSVMDGVWGGKTYRERAVIKRLRKAETERQALLRIKEEAQANELPAISVLIASKHTA